MRLLCGSLCSHMFGYFMFLFYSQSRSNCNVGFWIYNEGFHLESFSRRKIYPTVNYYHLIEVLSEFS